MRCVCLCVVCEKGGERSLSSPQNYGLCCWAVARSDAMRCDATSGLSSLENGEADDGDDGAVVGVLFERTTRKAMDGRVDAVCNKWTPPPE